MNLPLRAAIGNGGALFEHLNRAETLEDIFRAVYPVSDESEREGIAVPKSQTEWLAQRDMLQAEVREGMPVEKAAAIFPPLAVAYLALRDLKGSLKWFGEYQEAIAVLGQGFLIWGLAWVLRPIGYVIDHVDQYPPAETTIGYLRWFFKTTIEFLQERDYLKLRHYEPYYQQVVREGEEEKLLTLAYLALGLLLEGDISGPRGALAVAREFDQNTDTVFRMAEWVEKRAIALRARLGSKGTVKD